MLLETIAICASMFVFAGLPIILPRTERYSRPILLFGTGSLLGICAFDLLPDFYKLGGVNGLPFLVAVWVVYSLIHVFYERRCERQDDHSHLGHEHARSPYVFLAAITAHCFTSGILLGITTDLSKHFAETVFVALLVHKIYEAMTVSALLLSFKRTLRWTFEMLAIYLLSFPTGVIAARALNGEIHQAAILIISGLAIGSLLGCVVFDFVLPSARYVRQNNRENMRQLVWLLVGLVLTFLFI